MDLLTKGFPKEFVYNSLRKIGLKPLNNKRME
jgi:hypothetical protein